MLKHLVFCCMMLLTASAEPPVQGVRPTNLLGSSDQHASFNFIRPGLTQTAFAFSGPSSHQSFSSSIGNPYLAQKVYPNVANALAYRNPGLGTFPVGPIANGYATAPVPPAFVASAPAPLPYQTPIDPATLAYYQQLQQYQQPQQTYSAAGHYQAQLAQLLALRQAQVQAQAQSQVQAQATQTQQVPEQVELQQEEQQQPQNLLGIAYSSAPSVARVKVSGNGYKFDF
ncbi:uncharacterized protein LOC128891334 isoform X1 [Hylaeus anthracinus]|uniref:uncharacterized protein LOC128891334 isoform X1 n=2 Tax=Hylaeus anthracinus TaxID=313031 RepID=UPI0023B89BD2|nr:uncharacterized protein LOC128891334 isoform X1 [Hylaeus anthracinus]